MYWHKTKINYLVKIGNDMGLTNFRKGEIFKKQR